MVALTGAAFAFAPGMLDIVGQVGITEAGYVQWTMAYTQEEGPGRTVGSLPGINHNDLINAPLFMSGLEEGVVVNDARLINERGRTNQRIEWDVVFEAGSSARLYLEATNFSETLGAEIREVRIVEQTIDSTMSGWTGVFLPGGIGEFTPEHTEPPITVHPVDLDAIFSINFGLAETGGPAGNNGDGMGIMGTPGSPTAIFSLPPNNATLTNATSTTPVFFVELEWDGAVPFGWNVEEVQAMRWMPDTINWESTGTWVPIPGEYVLVFGDGDGNYFWMEDDDAPFIGTFTIELDYSPTGWGWINP